MDKNLYDMIFKRKSFHTFKNVGDEHISQEELQDIEEKFTTFVPLVEGIKVKMKIVKNALFCNRGQEYCILLYSEKKDNYLQNMGYIGEQLDLYLVSKNIGSLWYGIGQVLERQWEGMDYVIMFAIRKVDSADKFRKDMFKSKRKEIGEIWTGDKHIDMGEIIRFAPSACNSQPWKVEDSEDKLTVYRCRKPGRVGIMPSAKVPYFNQIDMGIFLCFAELYMENKGMKFERTLYVEKDPKGEKNLTASYLLTGKES